MSLSNNIPKAPLRRLSKKKPVAAALWDKIKAKGPGRIWIYEDFSNMPFTALAAALSRLHRKGKIVRIRPGIYYYPKETILGRSSPSPREILDSILRRKHIKRIDSGLHVLNKLKISDQLSNSYSIATDKKLDIGNISGGIKVTTLRRPLKEQKGITSVERATLDVCRDIHSVPNTTPERAVRRIMELIRAGELDLHRLMIFSKHEPPRVRALIGAIADDLTAEGKEISAELITDLRLSLNPLTFYRLGPEICSSLNSAKSWKII